MLKLECMHIYIYIYFIAGQVVNTNTRTHRQNATKLPTTLHKSEFKEAASFGTTKTISINTPRVLPVSKQQPLPTEKKLVTSKETNKKESNVFTQPSEEKRPIPAKRPSINNGTTTHPIPIPRKPSICTKDLKILPDKMDIDEIPNINGCDNQKKLYDDFISVMKTQNGNEDMNIIRDSFVDLLANDSNQKNIISTENLNDDLNQKHLLNRQRTSSLSRVKETDVLDDDEITNELLKDFNNEPSDKLDAISGIFDCYSKESIKRDASIGSFRRNLRNSFSYKSQQSIPEIENEEINARKCKSPSPLGSAKTNKNCNIQTSYGRKEAKIHIKFDNYINSDLEDALHEFHRFLETELSSNLSRSLPNKGSFKKPSHKNFTDTHSRFFTWNKKMMRNNTWSSQTKRRMLNIDSFENLSSSVERDAMLKNDEIENPRLNRSYSSSAVDRNDRSILHFNGSTSTINTENSDTEYEKNSHSRWGKMFRKYSSKESLKEDNQLNEEIGHPSLSRQSKQSKGTWRLKKFFPSKKHSIEKQ